MRALTIRPASRDRLADILALDRQCFGGWWTADAYGREIDSPNSDLLLLSGRNAGRDSDTSDRPDKAEKLLAVACQWAILEEAHITLLAVEPHHRRQGLASALMLALLGRARERSLERATLEVRASNGAALGLYGGFGFKEAGRRPHYYPDTGEDAAILWRSGLNHAEFKDELARWQARIDARLREKGWQRGEGN